MNKFHKQSGFTLIELIIVVVILGVIGGMALPRLTGALERHRAQEGAQTLYAVLDAQRRYFMENGAYATTTDALDISVTNSGYFVAPEVMPDEQTPTEIAVINRNNSAYNLHISDQGVILCDGDQATCAQTGFQVAP